MSLRTLLNRNLNEMCLGPDGRNKEGDMEVKLKKANLARVQ